MTDQTTKYCEHCEGFHTANEPVPAQCQDATFPNACASRGHSLTTRDAVA